MSFSLLPSDLLFLLLLPLCFLVFRGLRIVRKATLPPGPRPWPLMGNLLQLGPHPHETLAQMARAHGPLISLRLGANLAVVASSPAAAADILKTHDRDLSARYVPHTYRVGFHNPNALAFAHVCDERWKRLRTVCKTELFSVRALDLRSRLREEKVGEMVRYLSARRGEVVDIGETVFGTVFNTMGNLLFSRDAADLEAASAFKKNVSRVLELGVIPNMADFCPILCGADLQRLNRETSGLMERLYGFLQGLMGEKGCGGRSDVVEVLQSRGYSDLQIKALCSDLFLAGTDTVTSAVLWAMSELLRSPGTMARVREELVNAVGEKRSAETCAVREAHLESLTFLDACIKESLRLHPPAPLLLPRQALAPCEAMGYTIPKGCRVFVNAWAIGRDPETWKDPLVFSPERFLNSSIDFRGSDFEFIPFGAGRRICPGIPLARRLVPLILGSLLHSFEWVLPHGMQPHELSMEEGIGLTLARKHPLLLIPG